MVSKSQLISNVLTTRRYAGIAIISGTGLGIIDYFLTMSMLLSHLSTTMEMMSVYILTSVGLTITISVLAGINFAMMAFKIKRIKVMNSVKANSSALFGGICCIYSRMPCMYCTFGRNSRCSWRALTVSNARIGIKIHFSGSNDFFYLVDCKRSSK